MFIARLLAVGALLTAIGAGAADAKLIIVSHRGCRLTHPENTIVCFDHAIDIGVGWIETDVWESADGVLVLHHDIDLCRTTNIEEFPGYDCDVAANNPLGRFPRPKDFTLTELRQLDVGSWFDPAFAGTQMPTLEEAILTVEGSGIPLLLEVKTVGQAPKIKQILETHDVASENIIIWNRQHDWVAFKQELPDVRRIRGFFISEEMTEQQIADIAAFGDFGIAATSPGYTQEFVDLVKSYQLFLYSVPQSFGGMNFFQQLDLGVVGIHSQDPENVLLTLQHYQCVDGLDNDGDGLIDFDGYDEDLDWTLEWQPDPECIGRLDLREIPQCMDGQDNDGDQNWDWPNDQGCMDANDLTEAGPYAGEVPDGAAVAGQQLMIEKLGSDEIEISFGASCDPADDDYHIYRGTIGNYYNHTAETCFTLGQTHWAFTPDGGDYYYLAVPRAGNIEGSYGTNSEGTERPQISACSGRAIGGCRRYNLSLERGQHHRDRPGRP